MPSAIPTVTGPTWEVYPDLCTPPRIHIPTENIPLSPSVTLDAIETDNSLHNHQNQQPPLAGITSPRTRRIDTPEMGNAHSDSNVFMNIPGLGSLVNKLQGLQAENQGLKYERDELAAERDALRRAITQQQQSQAVAEPRDPTMVVRLLPAVVVVSTITTLMPTVRANTILMGERRKAVDTAAFGLISELSKNNPNRDSSSDPKTCSATQWQKRIKLEPMVASTLMSILHSKTTAVLALIPALLMPILIPESGWEQELRPLVPLLLLPLLLPVKLPLISIPLPRPQQLPPPLPPAREVTRKEKPKEEKNTRASSTRRRWSF
ncbi:hypothetical protein MKZ38_009823 [Zalerion maritima]|uniref:Uncharacterized protein n=1 Tax=Zalerion maritima TaxID=339359 RepID=A0AAD5RZV7_9PEZI|nr:hypothetical protein MKZ38_009823 [Zalerion maritima]